MKLYIPGKLFQMRLVQDLLHKLYHFWEIQVSPAWDLTGLQFGGKPCCLVICPGQYC